MKWRYYNMKGGLGHMTYFQISVPPNISGTAEDTNLKLRTLIEGKGPFIKQKMQN